MIEINHIGEAITAIMINESSMVRNFVASELGIEKMIIDTKPNVQLKECNGLGFDGAHKLDVGIFCDGICFPIELKLGRNRLTAYQVNNRFLTGCKTSHKDKRVSGNMISILERKLPGRCFGHNIYVKHRDDLIPLSINWAFICRDNVIKKWREKGFPNLSAHCKIISFEHVIDTYGGAM